MTVTQARQSRGSGFFAGKMRRLFGRPVQKKRSRKGLYAESLLNAGMRSYMVMPGQPVWMDRDYAQFAQEAYVKNVGAHRVRMESGLVLFETQTPQPAPDVHDCDYGHALWHLPGYTWARPRHRPRHDPREAANVRRTAKR